MTPFTGYRGKSMLFEIGGVKFVVMARSELALSELYKFLLPDAEEPFNPKACKPSIIIQSDLLPKQKT